MPSSIDEGLLYVDNPNKNIFFLDHDVDVLRKLGNILVEDYPSFQILAFDNWVDLNDDLLKERPTLFILELIRNQEKVFFEFIRELKKNPLLKDTPIIVTGTRDILMEFDKDIHKFECQVVPKAIRVPHFKSVVQACLNEASSLKVEIISLVQGENLFLQGDASRNIFIAKKGQLEVYHVRDGEEFILGRICEGEVVGEMAFIENINRTASVRALERCEVISLDLSNLHQYLEAQPFWLTMILKALVERLRDANQKNIKG